jgi:hypothetical protein
LLFVSPHFIESKYCYEIEGQRALARHKEGTAKVVPVILRACPWQEAPFGKLQALPQNGRPISLWDDIDVATLEVADGVMQVVDELDKKKSTEIVVAGKARRQRGPASKPRATQPKSKKRPDASKRTTGPTRGKATSRTQSRTDRG